MKKSGILVIGIFLVIGIVLVSKNSNALPILDEIEEINLILRDNNDEEVFKKEISNYIDLVDDNLIPNTSFNMSSKLNENYDFLTRFAISFILDNSEYYEIILGEDYVYKNEYGYEYRTNKYIDIDYIYEITNKVFGVEYYYILNDYIEIENDLVPLLELEEYNFKMEIDSIVEIDRYDNYIEVIVRYIDNSLYYKYTFEYIDDRYIISDLSIRE